MVARGFVPLAFTQSASAIHRAIMVPGDAARMIVTFMRRLHRWYAERYTRRAVLRTIEEAVGGR
jgi:hypothetical protein